MAKKPAKKNPVVEDYGIMRIQTTVPFEVYAALSDSALRSGRGNLAAEARFQLTKWHETQTK